MGLDVFSEKWHQRDADDYCTFYSAPGALGIPFADQVSHEGLYCEDNIDLEANVRSLRAENWEKTKNLVRRSGCVPLPAQPVRETACDVKTSHALLFSMVAYSGCASSHSFFTAAGDQFVLLSKWQLRTNSISSSVRQLPV